MDRLKKARAPVRAAITRTVNNTRAELDKDQPDIKEIERKNGKLKRLLEEVAQLDNKVKDQMLDDNSAEEDYAAELAIIEDYDDKIHDMLLDIDKFLQLEIKPPSPSNSSLSTATEGETRNKSYKLPKIELQKYDGSWGKWLGWWAQFRQINEDDELSVNVKFQYLVQAIVPGSEADRVIQIYPRSDENYPLVIEAFKKRFGNEKILRQIYIRELLSLAFKNAGNTKEDFDIQSLHDQLKGHLKSLESLGKIKDPMELIYPLVESSLPSPVLLRWQNSNFKTRSKQEDGAEASSLDNLMEFLRQEAENEKERKYARATFGSTKEKRKVQTEAKDVPTAASLYSSQQKEECIFCEKANHNSSDCFKAAKMSLHDKELIVKSKHCCFKCLRPGHHSKTCKTKEVSCKLCGKNHYVVMCRENEGGTKQQVKQVTKQLQGVTISEPEQTTSNSNQISKNKVVLMKTLHVKVSGTNGIEKEVRLLFDEGSQWSYIKTNTANELKCEVLENLSMQNSLFGGFVTEVRARKCHKATVGTVTGGNKLNLKLVNEDFITGSCPMIPQGPWIKELGEKNIRLTDTYQTDSNEVEVLIGSDLWGTLMTGKMVKLKCGLIAVESVFGWTLSGSTPVKSNQPNFAGVVINMLTMEERSLPKLWDLETIGIMDPVEKITQEEHDLQVKKKVQDNLTRDVDGRYVVKLPWIADSLQIPSNKEVAEKCLTRATEKLKKEGMLKIYDDIFTDWEKEGIIEAVDKDSAQDHFIPHRPVLKPDSQTTPVRPVFNASFKVGRNPSLNQCLEKGPNWLELIPSILLRFREKRIGVTSDIRKAFQMISVAKSDRNYQKFLWWENESKHILKVFRHCRVVFGLNCSPFLLAAVLEYHLNNVNPEERRIAETVKKSLYVDNCVMSVDTFEEFEEFKVTSIEIMSRAKMELRQWACSSAENSRIGLRPSLSCGWEFGADCTHQEPTTVLGYNWDTQSDTLCCKIHVDIENNVVTKRIVLSSVSQVFDPIGFTCPAILQAKKMLQESWAADLPWDTEWNEEQSRSFINWREELPELSKIKIPRNAFGQRKQVQLHTFCDASKEAYAGVVFARVQEQDQVTIQLLMAKSRLAPLDKKKRKTITIPRAELMGNLVGCRLFDLVRASLSMDDVDSYFWSDSTIALAWIQRDQDWGTFVGNRVREINKLTSTHQWRHVPGHMNPADLPSRGCSPSELLETKWWEGPEWLKGSKESWPASNEVPNEDEVLKELKRSSPVLVSSAAEIVEPRFSSFQKNVRVAGWIRRFATNTRKAKEDRVFANNLQMSEMRRAEEDLIRQVQFRHFPKEPAIKNLQVVKGEDGLWHVKTRLTYKEDTSQFRSPILLPSRDPLVEQLIESVHRSHCHGGAQLVLGKLRESVWIVHGRKAVNRVIHKCVVCRRHAAKPLNCDPAPLPAKRIETSYAFKTGGVDLAGPILLKGGKKCWIVLYTCAVYRGVWLDIVDSLSAVEFLDSLEKFTMTIGRPNNMFSDNGTNFVGAVNLLKKLDWKRLESKFDVKKIQWTFNPPTAAWWGGWWERLVRTIKDLLKKMIGSAKLTRKDLESCLASITYCINNRPLTTLTEDPDDLSPLTPAMFMRDLPIAGLPERELICSKDLQTAHAKVRDIRRALQERFRKEYLSLLVQKRNEKTTPDPKVGDVVLVGQDNKKRYAWPLGRIMELYPGKDGKTRVAKVKTAGGILLRPLQRLYLLEVPSSEFTEVTTSNPQTVEMQDINVDDESAQKTRSGREIKKPQRYGKWNS